MSKKIILIIIILVIIGSFIVYRAFVKEEESSFTLEKVFRGTVLQEVSETGQVKLSDEINFSFKDTGRIEKIYVGVGDIIESGQSLAKLDTTKIFIQLKEAEASLEVAQAQLDKLLAGSSPEEIKIAEVKVSNTEISYENAQQNLKDIEADAQDDLNDDYGDAGNYLNDSYLKSYNAFNTVSLIQRTYFYRNNPESNRVKEDKDKIEDKVLVIKNYLDIIKSDPTYENIDIALSETKIALNDISEKLANVRQICEEPKYRDIVSSTDKTSLDTARTNINTALTNITNSQQTVSSTKLTNEYNINTAEAEVSIAEGELEKAQAELASKKAGARQVDIDLYQAQVKQAQTKVTLLQNQMGETTLKSSVRGQITKINKREGEIIQPTDTVIFLIPESPFQIEVDIYEEDIVKVKVNNLVDVIIPAFPDETLKGKVISIDPVEKLIGGVVYYEVSVDFEEQKEGLKPGMTADIVIKTAFRENVLIISKTAVQKKDGKVIIQVLKAGQIEDREIELGLQGSDGNVEVISGLKEGEEVVIK